MKRALAIAWLAAGVGCVPALPSSYSCSVDKQCVSHGVQGVCEPTGACSFPDGSCASDKRYGGLGPAAFANQCVPLVGDLGSGDLGGPLSGDLGGDGGASTGSIVRIGASTLPPASHGSTATVPRPPGSQAGDLLVASLYVDDSSLTITAPAGWTTLADLGGGVGGAFRATWFYKLAGAAEPPSYLFVLGGSPDTSSGGMVDYRGVAAAPIDVSTTATFAASSFVAQSITTTRANDMLLAMFINESTTGNVGWTAPTGMATAVDLTNIGMFDQPQPAAGPSGTRQAALGVSFGIGAVDFIALTSAK